MANPAGYVKENASYPAHLFGDWLAGPEVKTLDAIEPGQGKSAICTHLGCVVKFNEA